jgi:hypothetical protein
MILGHVIVSRVMTLRSKKFGKYEVCDGLYNFLLCVINAKKKIIIKNKKSVTYPKDVFHDQY